MDPLKKKKIDFPKEITWVKKLLDLTIEQNLFTKTNLKNARGGLQGILNKPLTALLDPTQYENFITLVIIPFVRLMTEFHNSIFTKDDKYDGYGVASLKQNLRIIRKMVLSDNELRDVFVTHAFEGVFSIILEPETSVWCAKELLNCLGFCLGLVGPDIKETLRQSKDLQFNAANLVDLIPCKGDYEFQQIVLEFLYKLFGAKLVALSQEFCCYTNLIENMFLTEVNDENFLVKSREFLNSLNGPNGKVLSVLTNELFCGQVPVNAPKVLSKFKGVFIDFNIKTKSISFLIVRPNEQLTELSEEEDTVLLTIIENNVKKLDVEYLNADITLIFSLKIPIINIVTTNKNIVKMVFTKHESNATHLVPNVLPQIVDTKIIKTHQKYNSFKRTAALLQKEKEPPKQAKPLDVTLNRSMVMSHLSVQSSVVSTQSSGSHTKSSIELELSHKEWKAMMIKEINDDIRTLSQEDSSQNTVKSTNKPDLENPTETISKVKNSQTAKKIKETVARYFSDNDSIVAEPQPNPKIRAVTVTSPIIIEDSETESDRNMVFNTDNFSLEPQIGANEPDSEEQRLEKAANLVVDEDIIESTPQESQKTKKILQKSKLEKSQNAAKGKQKLVGSEKNSSEAVSHQIDADNTENMEIKSKIPLEKSLSQENTTLVTSKNDPNEKNFEISEKNDPPESTSSTNSEEVPLIALTQKIQESKKINLLQNVILQNSVEKPKNPTKPKEKSVENNSQDKINPKKDQKKQSESPYSQETVFNGNCPSDDLEIQNADRDETISKNGSEKDPEDNKPNSEVINPINECPSDDLDAKNTTKDSTKQLESTVYDQNTQEPANNNHNVDVDDSFDQIDVEENKTTDENEILVKSSEINNLVEQKNINTDEDVVEKSSEEVVPDNKSEKSGSSEKSNKKRKIGKKGTKKLANKKSDLSENVSNGSEKNLKDSEKNKIVQNVENVEKQTDSENIPLSQLLSNIVGQKSEEVGLAQEQNELNQGDLLEVLQNTPSDSKNNAGTSQVLKNNEIEENPNKSQSPKNKTMEEEFSTENITKLNLPRTRSQTKITKNEQQKQFQKDLDLIETCPENKKSKKSPKKRQFSQDKIEPLPAKDQKLSQDSNKKRKIENIISPNKFNYEYYDELINSQSNQPKLPSKSPNSMLFDSLKNVDQNENSTDVTEKNAELFKGNISSDEDDNVSFGEFSKKFETKNNFKNSKSATQTKKGSNSQETFKKPTPVKKTQPKKTESKKIDNNKPGSSNSSTSESEVSNNASILRRRRKLHDPTDLSYLQTLAPIIENENTKTSNLVDDNQNKVTVKESATKRSKVAKKKPEKNLKVSDKSKNISRTKNQKFKINIHKFDNKATGSSEIPRYSELIRALNHEGTPPKFTQKKPSEESKKRWKLSTAPIDLFASTPIASKSSPMINSIKRKRTTRNKTVKKMKNLESSSSSDDNMAQGHVSPEPRSNEDMAQGHVSPEPRSNKGDLQAQEFNLRVKEIANAQARLLCAAMSNVDSYEVFLKIVEKLDSFANKINKS